MDFIEDSFLGELTRWLSKSGELMFGDELMALAPNWTVDQKLKLYEYLRVNGERYESEWREQFVKFVGIDQVMLPEPRDAEEEMWGNRVFELIDAGDLSQFRAFVEKTRQLDQKFDPAEAFEEGRAVNKEAAGVVPFEFYPLEAYNEDSEYAEAYARKNGKVEIANFLKSAIEELKNRWKLAYEEGYRRAIAARRTFCIELHDDLSLSHNGQTQSLDGLIATALSHGANFLTMRIKRSSNASPITVWLPIQLEFEKAGIADYENEWLD